MARKRSLYELPGYAERGGYVYALLLSTGVVQAGRTADVRAEVTAERKAARARGIDVTDWWASIAHEEWIPNERALTAACAALGGKRTGPGFWSGVDFALLTENARDLTFTSTAGWAHGRRERHRETPEMRDKRMAVAVRLHAQGMSVREIAAFQTVSHTTIENDLARWERVKDAMPLEILRLSRPAGNQGRQTDPRSASSEEACLPGEVASGATVTPLRRLA